MNSVITKNLVYIFVIALFTRLEVEAVRPVRCPTNKIAPHRRIYSSGQGRTFGYFFNLFEDQTQLANGNLQEQPQADEPDDCGEIEDYDENDISSLNTPTGQRKGDRDERFFGWFSGVKPQRPPFFPGQQQGSQHTTQRPQPPTRPPRPRPPTRPPYNSGGIFANNPYRPPLLEQPSHNERKVGEVCRARKKEEMKMRGIDAQIDKTVEFIISVTESDSSDCTSESEDSSDDVEILGL